MIFCWGTRPLKRNKFVILVFCLRVGEWDVYDFESIIRRTLFAEAQIGEETVHVEAALFLSDRFSFESNLFLKFLSDLKSFGDTNGFLFELRVQMSFILLGTSVVYGLLSILFEAYEFLFLIGVVSKEHLREWEAMYRWGVPCKELLRKQAPTDIEPFCRAISWGPLGSVSLRLWFKSSSNFKLILGKDVEMLLMLSIFSGMYFL